MTSHTILLEGHRLVRGSDLGGIDSYWRSLVPELLRRADDEFRFLVLTAFLNPRHRRAVERLVAAGAAVRHWWASPEWLYATRRLGGSFEWFAGPHDLVHLPEPVLPLASRGRTVVTAHDVMYLHFPQYLEPQWVRRLLAGTEELARTATLWICVSEHTRDELIRHFHVPRGRTVVVPHGVAPAFFAAAEAPVRADEVARRLGLASDGYFLFVGSVEPKKNLPVLVEAFARAAAQGLRRDLAVAGRAGWGDEALRATLDRHPEVRDRIHFLGFVEQDDLPPLVAGARALVLPSRYEGFGMPVLEAMAAGTPVLVSNRGALPEVAGDAARLFDPDDVAGLAAELERLDGDDGLCEDMARRGRRRAAPFTWERSAAETVEAYRLALDLPR